MFNCLAYAQHPICVRVDIQTTHTPPMAPAWVCLTQGLAVGHCYIKEATPQCHPYTSNDKELLTILLTKIRSIEMN